MTFYKQINEFLELAKNTDGIEFTAEQVLKQYLNHLHLTGLYQEKLK